MITFVKLFRHPTSFCQEIPSAKRQPAIFDLDIVAEKKETAGNGGKVWTEACAEEEFLD